MTINPHTNLLQLKSDPLEVASLQVVKVASIWIGRFSMPADGSNVERAQSLFEPTEAFKDDIIQVDGDHNIFLVRNNRRWPVRFLNGALSWHAMLMYPVAKRAGASRVRQVQDAINNGFLRLMSVQKSSALVRIPDGAAQTISSLEAKLWMDECDLLKFCEFASNEWRFLKPVDFLRSRDEPKKQYA